MTLKEYEQLKIGDLVSPVKGINKGKLAKVTDIHDVTGHDGYREILIDAEYINPEEIQINDSYTGWGHSFTINYRQLKKIEA